MNGKNNMNRINDSLARAMEEIDLNLDTSSAEDADILRVDIDKLRSSTEDQILKLREEYLQRESELLVHLPEEEKIAMINSRPECLFSESSPLVIDDAKVFNEYNEKDAQLWVSPKDNMKSSNKSNRDFGFSPDRSKKTAKDDLAELESRIKAEMEVEYSKSEAELVKEYEGKMENAVRDVEIKLNQYWESRADELEEKIKALEDSKPKTAKDLDKKYQEYYEELLEKEKEELAEELEGKIREKYELLLQQEMNSTSGLDFETERQIREEMEYAFQQRLRDEKQAWEAEIEANIMHELRKKSDFSLKQKIEAIEERVKNEATQEINNKISEIKKQADEKISKYLADSQKDDIEALRQTFKDEYKQKLRSEQDSTLKAYLDPKQKMLIEQELRKELAEKLEKEIYEEAEQNLRAKVKNELADLYKNRQKKLRQDMKNKLKHAEEKLNEQCKSEIEQQVAEIIVKREKELMSDYKKQLERNKKEIEAQLTKEFEAKYLKERESLNDELTEITKNKALLTAQLKSVKQQKKEELSRIKKQREEIHEKLQELAQPVLEVKPTPPPVKSHIFSNEDLDEHYHENKTAISPIPANESVEKVKASSYFQHEPVVVEQVTRKIPSPAVQERVEIEPTRRRLLPKYNTQDLLNQILSQNNEEIRKAHKSLEDTQEPPIYYRKLIEYPSKK